MRQHLTTVGRDHHARDAGAGGERQLDGAGTRDDGFLFGIGVLGVHRAYLEAGADIIETNTFGATSITLRGGEVDDLGSLDAGRADVDVELATEPAAAQAR